MRRTPHALLVSTALLLFVLAHTPVHAQNTTFTYQGLLDDGGAPSRPW